MRPETEKELAYILLIELLAHQFAYPVRWIETQHAILGDVGAERVVEVGPSNTLTNMMTRTWGQGFETKDAARNVKRQFLGPKGGLDEVYYRTGVPETEDEEPGHEPEEAKPEIPSPPVTVTVSQRREVHKVPDVGVPASGSILCIVAMKLKKDHGEIQTDKSIGNLVGGRSTLSNEIVGDLHAEFPGNLPDRPEDMPLSELSQRLDSAYPDGRRLGTVTASLVAKTMSTKFPGGYTQSLARRHLQDAWGLGPSRQDAVLLLAVRKQPASRLSAHDAAEAFLSGTAAGYFTQEGLPLPASPADGGGGGGPAAVDSRTLQMVDEKNRQLLKSISDVITAHVETTSPEPCQVSTKDSGLEDLWLAEHGDDYAKGIVPSFDATKARVYDSYWNWNAQDIARFFTLCRASHSGHASPKVAGEMRQLSASIVNRSCDRSISQLKYLVSRAEGEGLESKRLTNTMWLLYDACLRSKDSDAVFINDAPDMAPLTTMDEGGRIVASEVQREKTKTKTKMKTNSLSGAEFPIGRFSNGATSFSQEHSLAYAGDLDMARDVGVSFAGKNVLLTGAGKDSIGFHVLRGLLSGGARVTVTTSSYGLDTARMYQALYARYGARGSVLRLVPFNQGSQQDVQNLVDWIYHPDDASWDLDFIVPFAAVSENGRDLENLDSRAEMAHRLMLTNLLRMLGAVARSKRARGVLTRPATVLLPLSPNHGLMGGDGLYSESKRSLEALLAKWSSESWSPYLSLLGVIIGWTRGTALMGDNDIVAQAVEAMGIRTFSGPEMAANLVVLMGGRINAECQMGPLVVDLGGGLGSAQGFQSKLATVRRTLHDRAGIQQAIARELDRDAASKASSGRPPKLISARANIRLPLPVLSDYDAELAPLAESLEGMVDLSRVVVITGFSELGPHGNSRTRWDMEAVGELSLEGCVEMAWLMGLIKFQASSGGWVDGKTGRPIDEADVYSRYMGHILEHSGLRPIEPGICDNGYDPERKDGVHEIVLQRNLPPFETTPEVAESLKRKHGRHVTVTEDGEGGLHAQLRAGATVMVPRASRFNRAVAGQIPTGWSAKRYGISDDIIEQVDPVTLFALVCTVEALLTSGVTDPYEFYRHVHLSELGICLGSSMGGLSSLRKMHRDRFLDKPVKPDVLQETFVNTTAAWINMLLTSSAGPIRTPVGACASSLESLDAGCDLIVTKKAKVVLVGGVEDFVEDVSYEFGSMRATCDTDAEYAAGRSPQEMSRPTASSRSGFVEAQGAGVQVLTSAELALEMGLPIYGIVAYTNMSADKIGRSVPAPGKGILTNAREPAASSSPSSSSSLPSDDAFPWPLLDVRHRRKMLARRLKQIDDFLQDGLDDLDDQIAGINSPSLSPEDLERHRETQALLLHEEAASQRAEAAFSLGNNFWRRDDARNRISPIRGSLATWGLDIDDISVASLHGTSTVKNDLNEPLVVHEQMRHLGRRPGNLLPCVCQKWLTGHSKGAAGAWMVNGCLQIMDQGVVPGNRNADNIDERLREHHLLSFPSTTLDTGHVKACSVTSFGFGQKGAQAILVHPRYLFATLSKESYEGYGRRRHDRWQRASGAYPRALAEENMVSACIKENAPYPAQEEMAALLDPAARF